MPSSSRKKYYAVREGREGPKIYDTWSECHANVSRWPHAEYKSFPSREDAIQWVAAPSRRAIFSAKSSVLPGASTLTPMTVNESITVDDQNVEHSQPWFKGARTYFSLDLLVPVNLFYFVKSSESVEGVDLAA
ncbi:hypothetical protein EDC04DRAFT_206462 [Pisolithus marmoratus]|nr:hypothetical protein EDC04DRAFT_206462 [Pisolithus marmoratus]